MFAVENYPSNGFACPISVLSTEEAEGFAEHFMELKQIKPDIVDQALGTNCHLLFQVYVKSHRERLCWMQLSTLLVQIFCFGLLGFLSSMLKQNLLFPGIRTAPIGDWNLQIL